MFSFCSDLTVLDISNFVINSGTNCTDMFEYLYNIRYISLNNTHIEDGEKSNEIFSSLNVYGEDDLPEFERIELLVCQKTNYIKDSTYLCCEKKNNSLFCQTNNYITVKYEEDTDYPCGFGIEIMCVALNVTGGNPVLSDFILSQYIVEDEPIPYLFFDGRNTISFININNSTYMSSNTPFKIKKDDILEIHFANPPYTLDYLFGFPLEEDIYDNNYIYPFIPFLVDYNMISVDFSHFNSSQVKSTECMFYGARSIKEINFSNFETTKVTSMRKMFSHCFSLLSLDLSNFDTSLVTNATSMFSSCQSLQYLDISNFNSSSLVKGPSSNVFIFQNLYSLKFLNIYNIDDRNGALIKDDSSLYQIDNLIICKKGEKGYFENAINICGDSYFPYPAINYVTINYYYDIDENDDPVNKYGPGELILKKDDFFGIGSYNQLELHFNHLLTTNDNIFKCSSIQFIDKKNISCYDFTNFDSSKMTNMNSMFEGCSSIEYINFHNFNTSSATDMSNMFKGCTNLKKLVLTDFDTSSVQNMDDMFNGLTLTSLNLTSFDTSKVTSMNNMFSGCDSLQNLLITNFNTEKLKTANNMFPNNLEYLDISNMAENEVIKKEVSSLESNNELLTCQSKNIKQNANNACCEFTKIYSFDTFDTEFKKMCSTNNYIKVKYGNKTEYPNGFGNQYRNGVAFINYKNKFYSKNEPLKIRRNGTIEIHFGYAVESLVVFFGYESNSGSGDKNVVNIISVDLSNFNSSLINDFNSMFQGCSSLKGVNFTNFDTSSVTNMKSMFEGCSSLEYLDLSGFNTSNVKDMSFMFCGCKSLKYLDISNFYIHYQADVQMIFNSLDSLYFINIFNIQNGELLDNEFKKINEKINDEFYACQKKDFISEDKATNICNNYIKACFGENVIYENGFNKSEKGEINEYRSNFLGAFSEYGSLLLSQINLEIEASSCMIITLNSSVESLAHFFDTNFDKNAEKIISIDFSSFNSSSLTDINSLFKGCKSLETVIFTNFNTSLVTNMSEMFSGCTQLKEIDLSFLDTSSLIDLHNMFYGCSNLEVIDLYGLHFDKIITAHNMFKDNDNMKYIDLLKLENSYLNFTLSDLNKKDNLTICQREDIIINTNAKYNCCYFDVNTSKCESAQYVIAFFDKNTISYENGFNLNNDDFRNYISFIVVGYNRKKLNKEEQFEILPNDKIEIHFSYDVDSLENLFYDKYDENVKYIHTIDFSPFNSSSLTNISHLFDGCSNLTSLDISYLDTSLVSDMSHSFSGFKSLISLNLTNFTTSNVKDMTEMFYNSTSLQYLDISNFDLSNCEEYKNIFLNLDNIRFINLVNLKDGKNIDKSINKEELFYICQSMNIIRNSFAYNCCDYNIELDVCEYILPTIIDSSSIVTPEDIQTTNTLLESTENIFDKGTTQEIADSTNIPNATNFTTLPTTVPTIIQKTVPTTIPITIPTTIPTTVQTTVPNTVQTTVPNTVP